MKTKHVFAAGTLTLALVSSAAFADMDWDGDADGLLDGDEFSEGFNTEDRFGAFDSNADGLLDGDEFGARMGDEDMAAYDGDGDGMLDNDEFTQGAYNRYDANRDGMIEESEFGEADDDMGEGGLFGLL